MASRKRTKGFRRSVLLVAGTLVLTIAIPAWADIIHTDDVIISPGSLCVGNECVNGENFGFDTIRLKEVNLRMHFDDTSTGSFPANDWRFTFNSALSGGASYFSVDDVTAGTQSFVVEAGAGSNALVLDSGGEIGIGTASPVVELHVVDGDSPTIRLEQNGSSGFTPQTWDMAGNETNFFIRDVTNGSKLPFRIRPNAPTSSIDIASTGNVGVGTGSPSSSLHVRRTNGTALVTVEEASGTVLKREMFALENNGPPQFRFTNNANADNWVFSLGDNRAFFINLQGTGGPEFQLYPDGRLDVGPGNTQVFRLEPDGDLSIDGTLTTGSDVNRKHSTESVDNASVLAGLRSLTVSTWSYLGETVRHMGPMAQDFADAFGLGATNTGISVTDAIGVAFAAIQELADLIDTQGNQIQALEQQNADLQSQLASLEERIARLEAGN